MYINFLIECVITSAANLDAPDHAWPRRPCGGGPRIELTHDAPNVKFYRADANSDGVGDKLIAHAHAHAHARSEICEDVHLATCELTRWISFGKPDIKFNAESTLFANRLWKTKLWFSHASLTQGKRPAVARSRPWLVRALQKRFKS